MAKIAKTKRVIPILNTNDDHFVSEWCQFYNRDEVSDREVEERVYALVESVRADGDRALLSHALAESGAELENLEVSPGQWDSACDAVEPATRAAIGKSATRIRDFHRKRMPGSWEMREEGGGYMAQRVRPLRRVGICSSVTRPIGPAQVIMNATPASAVEVPEICLALAPGPSGEIRPEVLMAARVAGVHRVFKVGGPAAISAFAYGTESIPRVEKLLGSLDAESQIAQQRVAGAVGFAGNVGGPREVCFIADNSADPAWLAADMLAEIEGNPEARLVLVTHHKGLANKVGPALAARLEAAKNGSSLAQALARSAIVVVSQNLAESLALADEFAPEQVVLWVSDSQAEGKKIQNAGSVIMGPFTPPSLAEWMAGPNALLPTGGTARFSSPLGVEDFLKRTNLLCFEPSKLRELGGDVIRLAEVEDRPGHGASMELRLNKIRRVRREREAARAAEL